MNPRRYTGAHKRGAENKLEPRDDEQIRSHKRSEASWTADATLLDSSMTPACRSPSNSTDLGQTGQPTIPEHSPAGRHNKYMSDSSKRQSTLVQRVEAVHRLQEDARGLQETWINLSSFRGCCKTLASASQLRRRPDMSNARALAVQRGLNRCLAHTDGVVAGTLGSWVHI